jgi:hypothetical protein
MFYGVAAASAPIPMLEVRSVSCASGTPTADEATAAANVLRQDGVVVIKCCLLEALAPPAENAEQILAGVLARVDRTGIDHDQPFAFAEVCHRAPRRYDVHLGAGSSQSEFSMLMNSLVSPVLALCSETPETRILRDGLVTSLPGASAQPFHADGRDGRLFNAFLPLVAVRSQGTEFWLGSHKDPLAAGRLTQPGSGAYVGETILEDADVAARICAPALSRAEGIILFDYRVVHRGRAHGAHEAGVRPVFYRVFTTDGAEEDGHNWPSRTLADHGG